MEIINCFLIFSIIIITSFNCSPHKSNIDFHSFNYSYKDQNFSVVLAYLNMRLFVSEAKNHPIKINKLYEELIYQPILTRYVAKGEYAEIMKTLKPPITDIDTLQEEIV